MHPLIRQITATLTPEQLVDRLQGRPGIVLLHSALFDSPQARYSLVTACPFLTFRSFGSRCELTRHTPVLQNLNDGSRITHHALVAPESGERGSRFTFHASRPTPHVQFGDPWRVLDDLMSRYELLDEVDLPFPLGGCFGFWGYDLKNFVEPKLPRRAPNDLELPDCHVGFYSSLVVFDHHLAKTWIVATGLDADGSRSARRAAEQARFWERLLGKDHETTGLQDYRHTRPGSDGPVVPWSRRRGVFSSTLQRPEFLARVRQIQSYIRAGDIYQANLSHRLEAPVTCSGWNFYQRLSAVSPAPFSAYLDCGDFQFASSSPELFLRMSGSHIQTRPIKGTRPRSFDPTRDAQLTYELQTSAKEMAELVMITDLLRNDLGKVCEFGSVQVPELVRLERYPQVQHLVSTVEGRLRQDFTHFGAFASCFPGGSVTGAPKFRAMAIIDELEPVSRGPYTGALGYLGFNRESQLSIIIRAATFKNGSASFPVGAGIVADSDPAAEYEETLAKAAGFFAALALEPAEPTFQAKKWRQSNKQQS